MSALPHTCLLAPSFTTTVNVPVRCRCSVYRQQGLVNITRDRLLLLASRAKGHRDGHQPLQQGSMFDFETYAELCGKQENKTTRSIETRGKRYTAVISCARRKRSQINVQPCLQSPASVVPDSVTHTCLSFTSVVFFFTFLLFFAVCS